MKWNYCTATHSNNSIIKALLKRRLLPEILGQLAPVEAKSPIFSRYSLIAPQQ